MTEAFLYFIWQFQYFQKNDLKTSAGQPIKVLQTGRLNSDSGADFQDSRLFIDGIEWFGSVEIHVKASDWHLHQHQSDAAYNNVILHVVWQNDATIARPDGTALPVLELQNITDPAVWKRYDTLLQTPETIPCGAQFGSVDELVRVSMLDKTLTQRLERKAEVARQFFEQNQNDWEETAYQLLAYNFGFKINADPFLQLARAVPLKILQKHRNNLPQVEALLYGAAGLLAEPTDEYSRLLAREYKVLTAKYSLQNKQMQALQWKFLRLRPANFPTVRLAQFAQLVAQQASLFSVFINIEKTADMLKRLQLTQSDYWQKHYVFGKETTAKVPAVGRASAENILINTVVPLLVIYGQVRDQRAYLEKALEIVESLPAERNHITDNWEKLGVKIKTAYDSQGVIEWFNEFCSRKRCLACGVGVALVRKQT